MTVFATSQKWREGVGPLRDSWDRSPVTLTQVDAWRESSLPVVALVSSLLPARGVTRVDPVEVLKEG